MRLRASLDFERSRELELLSDVMRIAVLRLAGPSTWFEIFLEPGCKTDDFVASVSDLLDVQDRGSNIR